jgi:hypothetical protein
MAPYYYYYIPSFTGFFLEIKISKKVHKNMCPEGHGKLQQFYFLFPWSQVKYIPILTIYVQEGNEQKNY